MAAATDSDPSIAAVSSEITYMHMSMSMTYFREAVRPRKGQNFKRACHIATLFKYTLGFENGRVPQ